MKCNIPLNDLNQRLNETIIRYKGVPMRCRTTGGDILELHSMYGKHPAALVNVADPDLDISSVPLGNVQIQKDTVVYVSRKPARLWKQGVNNDTLNYNWLSKTKRFPVSLWSKEIHDCILGLYPSLDDALKLVKLPPKNPGPVEIAISRDVALQYIPDLQITHVFYKGTKIGFIIKDSNTVITPTTEMGWIISRYLSCFNWKVE